MAIASVAAGSASGSGTTLAITGVTCAAGNVLVIDTLAVNTGNSPIAVLSVTDNTSPPPSNSYVIPPNANFGAFFSGQNQFANTATIWCEVVKALSSATVTVTFTASAGFNSAEWQTYSGLPPGLTTVASPTASTILASATTVASPSAIVPANCLVIAVANINGAANAVSNSYTLRPDNMSAWLGTTSAGSTSTTFTLTASTPVWGSTLIGIGQAVSSASEAQPGRTWLRRFRRQQHPLTVVAQGSVIDSTGATLAGAGAVSAAAVQGAGAFPAGAGAVSALAVQQATVTIAAAASVSAAAVQAAGASLAGAGALSAGVTQQAGTAPAGAGSLGALATQQATASPAGAAVLTATSGALQTGTATLAAASVLTASARQGAGASITAAGSVTAAASSGASTATNATSAPLVTATDTSSPAVSGAVHGALVTAQATSQPGVSDG